MLHNYYATIVDATQLAIAMDVHHLGTIYLSLILLKTSNSIDCQRNDSIPSGGE